MSDVNGHLQKVTGLSHGAVIAITVIALAVLLAFYALRSIGIYVIAKKQEQKHAFLAFVPFAWLYIVCKLLGPFQKLRSYCALFFRLQKF